MFIDTVEFNGIESINDTVSYEKQFYLKNILKYVKYTLSASKWLLRNHFLKKKLDNFWIMAEQVVLNDYYEF